jgi:hypothetical protein
VDFDVGFASQSERLSSTPDHLLLSLSPFFDFTPQALFFQLFTTTTKKRQGKKERERKH